MHEGQEVRDEAYRMVVELLVGFRRIVHRALLRVCGNEWFEKGCPLEVRRRILERQELERAVDRGSTESDDLFGHATFVDLADIIEFIVNAWWIRLQSSRTFAKFLIVGASGVVVNLGFFSLFLQMDMNK